MNAVYNETIYKFWNEIGAGKEMVLSTSIQDHVTSRTVFASTYNGKVYVLTNLNTTKQQQIEQNPNIALCFNSISLTGQAKLIGHPLDVGNKEYANAHKAVFPEWYEQYSKLPGAVMIEITPITSKFYIWEASGHKGYSANFDEQSAESLDCV